jgi:hypothetical protein
MLALTNDQLLGFFFGQQQLRRRHGGNSGSGKETTARNRIFHKH